MLMKKSEISKLSPKEKEAKIAEMQKAILELRGEGRTEKVKTLKKTIASLMQKA
jgi:ribosomal protein L29